MNKTIRAGLLAGAMALSAAMLTAPLTTLPAYADIDVDFNYFHDQLGDYGDWFYSDRWGEVWAPSDVPDDWRPFTAGHWVDTDEYGWMWVSDEPFGDITAHYGRWVDDPDDGWMWIPGYVWSPGWVIWHRSGDYVGWMPMPPDDRFLDGTDVGGGAGVSVGIASFSISFGGSSDDDYGYRRWYGSDYSDEMYQQQWHFVPLRHFDDPDYRRYEPPRQEYRTIIHNSVSITNYTVVNNYIVNRSVSPEALRRAGAPPVRTVRAAQVFKRPPLIMSVDRGRRVQDRMRVDTPRGTGAAHSAPAPTEAQVQTLSARPPRLHPGAAPGAHPSHLLLRGEAAKLARPNGSKPAPLTPAAIEKARAAGHPGEAPQPGAGGAMPGAPGAGERKLPSATPQPFVEHGPGRINAPRNPAAPPKPKRETPAPQMSAPTTEPTPTRPAERMRVPPTERMPAPPTERMPTRPAERMRVPPTERMPAPPTERMPTRPAERMPAPPTERMPTRPAERMPAPPTERMPTRPVERAPVRPEAPAPREAAPSKSEPGPAPEQNDKKRKPEPPPH